MKISKVGYLIFVISILTVNAQENTTIASGSGMDFIGHLKPRTTHDIVSSDLWIGGEVLDRDYTDYHEYKPYLDSLGAKKIRLQSGWAKTEKQKGVYDFAWLDRIVNDAMERKVQPWIQISYGNELYPDAGGISLGEGLPQSEEALEAWLKYTKALVVHFRDRVNEWEIWNEADHRYNNAGPEPYANLYYRTGKAIREVQPNAKLIGLSIAGVGKTDYVDFFLKYLQERNALDLLDIVTFHGYPRNPDQGFDAVAGLEALIYTYRPGVKLWQGETGCPSTFGSSGALSGYPWSEIIQAKWNLRRALAHVGRGYPFSLFTISEYTYDRKKFKGLNTKGILKVNDDLSVAYAKPAYYAYQNLTALLDHQFERMPLVNYSTDSDSSLSVFAFLHKVSKSPMVFFWMNGNIPSNEHEFTNTVFSFENIVFSDPLIIDLLSGEVYETAGFGVGDGSSIFRGIPIADYPFAIVERKEIRLE